MAKPKNKQASRKEAFAIIWAAYRASLPYVLIFVGSLVLITWLITEVFL